MEYYRVKDIIDRRVDAYTGAVEYLVRWEGYADADSTWEPRQLVVEYCADEVQRIDQQCMEKTDGVIGKWRRRTPKSTSVKAKRRRATAETSTHVSDETLTGVLVRSSDTSASVVLLGELVLTEEASLALSVGRRRKQKRVATETGTLCRPAIQLAKQWSATCTDAVLREDTHLTATPLKGNFTSKHNSVAERANGQSDGTDRITILGIAPAEACVSGHPYVRPATCVPWLGIEATEQLLHKSVGERPWLAPTAQELIAPQCDMVVRFCDSAHVYSIKEEVGDPKVLAMPLSVFREVFPQVLIDYLLDGAAIVESTQ